MGATVRAIRCPANGEACACAAGSIRALDCAAEALDVAERLRRTHIHPSQHAAAVSRAQCVRSDRISVGFRRK